MHARMRCRSKCVKLFFCDNDNGDTTDNTVILVDHLPSVYPLLSVILFPTLRPSPCANPRSESERHQRRVERDWQQEMTDADGRHREDGYEVLDLPTVGNKAPHGEKLG